MVYGLLCFGGWKVSNYILISKDAMCTDYLPVYGNKNWKTPNIDKLAEKGTVFLKHHTAAPSTVMSFFSMITGKYSHESGFDVYKKTYKKYEGDTLFKKLIRLGYECHIIWAQNMMPLREYLDYFLDDVELHPIDIFRQGVGAHYIHKGFLSRNSEKEEEAFSCIEENIKSMFCGRDNVFLWIHFPHVIKGEVSYGSDIELFDKYIGMIRKYINDDCIAITADHGNMNGHKGKLGYAFDVYEPNIKVPLITPRINGLKEVDIPTSSLDLYDILFEKKIEERKYIFSDSAYRAQTRRKLSIIHNNFKYIYNKQTKTEELFDLLFDPEENFSLMFDYTYDKDRKITVPSRELYYYPNWNELDIIRKDFRRIKDQMWEKGRIQYRFLSRFNGIIRPFINKFDVIKKNK